ncbi:FixH family protein [Flammeovirgaceae bacterium SG7u.111]|nr:FixH family protein [Flammeovirgaceae bacterium SG7u.132]WPO35028.1 FixH family protein [Flammeovirgaceae bacterium SG7u.111]
MNYIKNILLAIGFTFSVVFLAGCGEDEPVEPTLNTEGKVMIAEGYALGAGAKVKVYGKEKLFSGYNQLFVAVYDSISDELIEESHVSFMPMMAMNSGMSHSAPYENPASSEAKEGFFEGAVVFLMPSMMGTWTLDVHVHNHKNMKEGMAKFEVMVAEDSEPRIRTFESKTDQKNLFVSYKLGEEPKVGINDIEFVVNSRKTMMEFLPEENYTFEMTPEMPTMGHGSPNNVNPTHTEMGHYAGKLNFTMTGLWRVNLVIKEGGDIVAETSFDITF